MKRNMIISAVALAGAGLATYLFRKSRKADNASQNGQMKQRSHHLTNSFAKAKQHANDVVQ